MPARQCLALTAGNQRLQRVAVFVEQHRQLAVEHRLGLAFGSDGIEFHHGVQTQPAEHGAPGPRLSRRRCNEVEHRQQRDAAKRENFQLVAVFIEHRVAGIDDVQRGIAGAKLTQHLGLLLEAPSGLGAGKEAGNPRRAVQTLVAGQRIQTLEQSDRVFQARRVVKLDERATVDQQAHALDMTGGAGTGRYFAESGIAAERAHQRGLAGVGVADQGQANRRAHDRSPSSATQASAAAPSP